MKARTAAVALVLVAQSLWAQERAPQNESIRQEDLRADLFFLASDEMQGRLTGTRGNRLAAEFIKSRFERLGLKPAGPDNSYFQSYDLITTTLGRPNLVRISGAAGAAQRLELQEDYYPRDFSASRRVRGSVVYVGFGITAPDLSYDDYAGASLEGTIVLALDHEPGERDPNSPFDGVVTSELSQPLRKALSAQERGAVGILFVTDVHNHDGLSFGATARRYWPEQRRRVERLGLGVWMDRVHIPAVQISPAVAETLVRGTNRALDELARSAETEHGISPVPLQGVEIDLTITVDRQRLPERNVVGLIEGTDPRLADEWVIISAHYDHMGADGSRIFNGADDNGSGVVGLIEIAEAYALAERNGQRPRRSVLFAAWNAEERGELGAWAYTEQPLTPLESTVAVLNMDMIGRDEEVPENGGSRFRGLEVQTAESNHNAVNILGYSRSTELKLEVEKANASIGLDVRFRYDNNRSNLLRRSDQWPFLYRGVPAVFIHSGLHPDYHTAGDRPEKINYEKMEKIVRLVHQLSWNLVQQEGRPRLD